MADKYLDIDGLKKYNQIIDGQKANLESPAFTGFPTVNGVGIATKNDIPTNHITNGSTDPNQVFIVKTGDVRFVSATGNLNMSSGNSIMLDGNKGIALHTSNDTKATYNGEELATKLDVVGRVTAVSEPVEDEEGTPGVKTTFLVSSEPVTDFTVMDGHKGERGTALLHVTTAPWANTHQTPDRVIHTMALKESEVLVEAKVDSLYLGDIIEWNGFIYQIAYLGDPFDITITGQGTKKMDVYVDSIGNIKGPQGIQGIQGNQGPQGPKGDPGEGYFIVTDEDYAKIADFVEEKSYHSYQRPDASEPIRPNIFYDFGPQYQLEITFEAPQSEYRSNEYMFQFESPSDRPTTLVMPSGVKWCYDPVIEAGKTYQVSVLNNLAVICGA